MERRMAISLVFCMTESERTLKMPNPERRMIIETTMPAEMRNASKMARFPAWRCCHDAEEWEIRSSNSAARSGAREGVEELDQHEGGEVGLVQQGLRGPHVDEHVLDIEIPDAGFIDHVDAETAGSHYPR